MSVRSSPLPPVPPVGHVTVMRASRPDFVGVFVEGPSDVSMWRRWLRWEPVNTGGKGPVLTAIADLLQRRIPGCVGIIDADLDHLEGRVHPPGIVLSEGHDREGDLARSPALDELVAASAGPAAVSRLIGTGATLRGALVERALPFGLLRWRCHEHGIEFPAGRLSPFRFVDKNSWGFDENALYDEAALTLAIRRDELDNDLSSRRARLPDAWHVCNGHDLVAILTIALQHGLGLRKRYPTEESVDAALSLALDSTHLAGFPMWRNLGAWEMLNRPFEIRKCPRGRGQGGDGEQLCAP